MEKNLAIKNGASLLVRPLKSEDLRNLMNFYVSLPDSDRSYLRIDVTDEDVVRQRIQDAVNKKDIRLAALSEGMIVATGALELSTDDWKKNQGELRLIVARDFQRRGVGMMMARELYFRAAEQGIEKLVVKMMKPQIAARNIFQKLGFHTETVLPEYVMDQFGRLQDLLIMTCDMKDFWRELEQTYQGSDWRRCR